MIDILGGISNPLTEAAVAGAVGLAALAFRRWRTGSAIIVAAATWACLCATPAFAFLLWQGLANQYPPKPPADYPRADAIVLVGGGPLPMPLNTWDATTQPDLATPLGFATALYRAGKAPLLVAAGDYGRAPFRQPIARAGIPATALRPEPASQTTHQDAEYSREALQASANPSILLVATGTHMPRTVAAFRKQGFQTTPAPTLHPDWTTHWPRSLQPTISATHLSRSCLHEYIGLIYYRLRGWATW